MSGKTVLTQRSELESAYRSDGRRLWRSLVAYCGDRDVADEAVAEAYAQALRRGGELRHPGRWVWKAAFRIAAGDLQRRSRSRPLQDRAVVHNPEPGWDLIDALGRLPERQRAWGSTWSVSVSPIC
jgi:RNA polymerase sigma-70 factor (ECF subfamily)